MNKQVTFLTGTSIYLRPASPDDIPLVERGKNDPAVRETLFLFQPVTREMAAAEQQSWSSSKETALFTICESATDEAVGQTAFVRIDHVSRAAVFYIAIYDPGSWSKGYGSEATRLMLHYAFDILNLNRVQLHVAVENTKGVKAYQKAGFTIEGTLREAMYHNNKYCDFYVMGILRKEYYAQQEALKSHP